MVKKRERRLPSTSLLDEPVPELAGQISVSALVFQAKALIERLSAFTDHDFPAQTLAIADILRVLASRSCQELVALDELPLKKLTATDRARVRDLGRIVQVLHSYLRYLQSSDPLRTPPGVQHAISLLISAHGQSALNCHAQDICVLVRPQWTYNLKFIDIIPQFEVDAGCVLSFALDPQGTLGVADARSLVDRLWDAESSDAANAAPTATKTRALVKHSAVLSFAGLDRDDVLLYPLLAHELGHFLDFASNDTGATDANTSQFLPTIGEVKSAGIGAEEHKLIVETIRVCLREITADLLAARMAGLGYFFAFSEFFKTLTPWPGPFINPESGYPGFGLRLKLIWKELASDAAGILAIQSLRAVLRSRRLMGHQAISRYVTGWERGVNALRFSGAKSPPVSIVEKAVRRAIPAVQKLARDIIPTSRAATMPPDVDDMVSLLNARIPPFQPTTRTLRQRRNYSAWSFHEVLTAGWLYQIGRGESRERAITNLDRRKAEYDNTCLLLLKALELEGARSAMREISGDKEPSTPAKAPVPQTRSPRRGVMSGPSLRAALNRKKMAERLVLCPDFGDGPIEAASRDLHLGHWFRVSRRTSLDKVDIAFASDRAAARRQGQLEVFVPSGGKFVLQPGDFALAASMEYVYLPPDLMAFVEGKSSLGRAGLLIATATQVAPGFKGCIVLELYNAGTVPVILRPGMKVAQLVVVATDRNVPGNWLYSGSFQVQIKP